MTQQAVKKCTGLLSQPRYLFQWAASSPFSSSSKSVWALLMQQASCQTADLGSACTFMHISLKLLLCQNTTKKKSCRKRQLDSTSDSLKTMIGLEAVFSSTVGFLQCCLETQQSATVPAPAELQHSKDQVNG